jgi:hypothetical protein
VTARAGLHAFAFQTGDWRVRHRKLKRRLVGETEWLEFGGTCRAWEVMAGAGNVEEHFLDDPTGPYHASTMRRLDPASDRWSIWWFDSRDAGLGPPVQGRFEGGVGTFFGDDLLDGRPIVMRFIWSGITADAAQWEQAFSPDRGTTWETNWVMRFERVG